MIKLHFYSKSTLIAKAIKNTTRSKWNHVSIEINGNVYEAIGGRLFGSNGILKSSSPYAFHHSAGSFTLETITLNCFSSLEEREIENWCDERVGSKYDTLEALSFKWKWLKGKANLYICSSYTINALAQSLEIIDVTDYYSPEDVYRLAKAINSPYR